MTIYPLRGQQLTSTIAAIRKASGVSINQAKTAAYYAVATFLDVDPMPILVILGKAGTGKSSLMEQLAKLVNQPRWINAKSSASLRTELSRSDVFTALIEEGDKVDEDLIANRYARETAQISLRMQKEIGWQNINVDIFGATILHRRIPLSDLALRSRSIILRTEYHPSDYEVQEVGNEEVKEVAAMVGEIPKTSHRVEDTWRPLIAVAEAVGDKEWLAYAIEQIERDKKALVAGQSYEPEKALVFVLRALMVQSKGVAVSVNITKIKERLRYDYDLYLKSNQIEEMCLNLGFKVTHPSGYPTVQPNLELLKDLIVEQSSE